MLWRSYGCLCRSSILNRHNYQCFGRGGLLQLFISHLSVKVMPKLLFQPRENVHPNFKAANANAHFASFRHEVQTRALFVWPVDCPVAFADTASCVESTCRQTALLFVQLGGQSVQHRPLAVCKSLNSGLRLDLSSMAS